MRFPLEGAMAAIRTGILPEGTGLRPALALREFVSGQLDLPDACQLGGLTGPEFIDLLARLETLAVDPSLPATGPAPRLSVVIPVYNEEDNLGPLHERLAPVLAALGSYEIVFVDDGSADRSVSVVHELQRRDANVRLIQFSRNFGHQAALSAGLDAAGGDAVVFMDADLQDPPELLVQLFDRWEQGFEVVYAVRQQRDEGLFKKATAALFYRLLRSVSDVEIPLDAGDFCLMDRKVADVLRALPEKNRFLRGLRSWAGFRQVGVLYDRPARHAGETKYTLPKMAKLAVDGVMAFTSLPLRMASFLGFLTVAAGLAYLAVAVGARLTSGTFPNGWTSLVAIILLIGGAQLVVLGVLGAYVARVYEETKQRPMYVIDSGRFVPGSGDPPAGLPGLDVHVDAQRLGQEVLTAPG
ncbi:MAG: glycosyltransferase family 2 protein [Acidimicrobiia bacterium]